MPGLCQIVTGSIGTEGSLMIPLREESEQTFRLAHEHGIFSVFQLPGVREYEINFARQLKQCAGHTHTERFFFPRRFFFGFDH